MSKIWVQSLKGRAVDLVDVDARPVDLREMCEQLAGINRHCGAAQSPVSVAMHTLIALDCAEDAIKPWVSIARFHEARTGHVPEATRLAIAEIAVNALGGYFGEAGVYAWGELTKRHDVPIHATAGLPMPTPAQAQRIALAFMRAEASERRDFMAEVRLKAGWTRSPANPSTKVYRVNCFGKSAFDVGEALFKRLQGLLPALAPVRPLPSTARAGV